MRPTDPYWSDEVGPVVNFFRDPNPPTVTDVPDVTSTTLPDTANQSRITLTMNPLVSGAAGCVIWYATETQLLKALDDKGLLDGGLSAAQADAVAHPAFANLDKRAEVLKNKVNGSNAVDFAFIGAKVWNVYSFETDVLFEADTHDRGKIPILSTLPTFSMMNNEILFGAAHQYHAILRFHRSPSNAFPRQFYLYVETFDLMETILVPDETGWTLDPQNLSSPPLKPVQVPVFGRRLRILRLTDPLGRTTDKALKTVIP